jgi:hypothetical protein
MKISIQLDAFNQSQDAQDFTPNYAEFLDPLCEGDTKKHTHGRQTILS